MKRSNSEIVHGFGTVVSCIGGFAMGFCMVALVVTLVRSGNVAAVLAIGIALGLILVYVGAWCRKLATLNEILSLNESMGGAGDGGE